MLQKNIVRMMARHRTNVDIRYEVQREETVNCDRRYPQEESPAVWPYMQDAR